MAAVSKWRKISKVRKQSTSKRVVEISYAGADWFCQKSMILYLVTLMSAVFFYKSTRFPCEIDPINYVNQKFMRFYTALKKILLTL